MKKKWKKNEEKHEKKWTDPKPLRYRGYDSQRFSIDNSITL